MAAAFKCTSGHGTAWRSTSIHGWTADACCSHDQRGRGFGTQRQKRASLTAQRPHACLSRQRALRVAVLGLLLRSVLLSSLYLPLPSYRTQICIPSAAFSFVFSALAAAHAHSTVIHSCRLLLTSRLPCALKLVMYLVIYVP